MKCYLCGKASRDKLCPRCARKKNKPLFIIDYETLDFVYTGDSPKGHKAKVKRVKPRKVGHIWTYKYRCTTHYKYRVKKVQKVPLF